MCASTAVCKASRGSALVGDRPGPVLNIASAWRRLIDLSLRSWDLIEKLLLDGRIGGDSLEGSGR